MLIPQFSLRRLLAVMTGCSLVFLVLSLAVRGQYWAIGVTVGLLTLLVISLVHGLTFFAVWLFATVTGKRKAAKCKSALVALLAIAVAQHAFAAGGTHTLPANGKPTQSGLVLNVDSTWPRCKGYQPLTLSVTSSPPANADRTLSFEFRSHLGNPNDAPMTIKTDLELPAGVAQAAKTIAIPDVTGWTTYRDNSLDTWQDGKHVPALSTGSLGTGIYYDVSDTLPAVLYVGTAEPDASSLLGLFPQPQYGTPSGTKTLTFTDQWAWRAPDSLPDEWLCYQGLDLVFVSLADLHSLSAARLNALRDWTRAGGNLVVYGVGDDFAGLAELDQLLRLESTDSSAASHWQSPANSNYRDSFADVILQGDNNSPVVEMDEHGNVVTPVESALTPPPFVPFRVRPLQQGMIVALAPGDPFGATLDSSTWYWIFNTLGSSRWIGAKRTGINCFGENPDFWMFLIPGVGGAPVDAYRVLITAFVVLIGPVNYLLLRKYKRLHLLLFTVPASALIVTTGLLAYALIADGLHTRVRSRSLTLLDQRSGDAVSWSRLAYYSGLAPSGGLRFDRDIAPIPFLPEARHSGSAGQQVFESLANENRLSRGWLLSRTPTQFVTARPYRTAEKVEITEQAGSTVATNQLGQSIQHLLVCSASGEFGYAADLRQGQTRELTVVKSTMPKATAGMRKAFDEQTLAMPIGYDGRDTLGILGYRSYSYHHGYDQLMIQQSTSRLEQGLAAAKSALLQAGAAGDAAALGPRSYLAIVDRPRQISLGLDGASETEGFHVIRGTW